MVIEDDSSSSSEDSERRFGGEPNSDEDEDGVPNPDTFNDYYFGGDDSNWWLSQDQLFELQTAKDEAMKIPPPLTNWVEIDPMVKPEVTVAKARRLAWKQGHAEVHLHRKNVAKLPTASSMTARVYQYMFGSDSELSQLFCGKLGLTKEEYLLFLITYFKSCRYKMSVPNLHASDDNTKNILPTDKYNEIWRTIMELPRHAHGESFWQEVEGLLNGVYRTLFMEADSHEGAEDGVDDMASRFRYVIGLDDDKLHYDYMKTTRTDGLKKDHHAKDNRHGFTAHTACASATAAPLQVSFQRRNETVRSTTERMVDSMFGKHVGRVDRLDNVELATDRGYWDPVLLFGLLDQGGDIHGTIMRGDWVPLTFNHPNEKDKPFPCKPRDITLFGYRDSFHMQTIWRGGKSAGRKLACIGYRSGTGTAASVALSSSHRQVHWDMIPATAKDQRWYHDKELTELDRQKKAIVHLEGAKDDETAKECVELVLNTMEPRTCRQGTAEWFIDRQLSGTSSTIAGLIMAVAPLVSVNDEIYDAFKVVLDYATGSSDVIGTVADLPQEDDESSDEDEADEDSNEERKQAEQWIATLTDKSVDMDAEFQKELDGSLIDPVVLSWMVALLRKKEYKDMTAQSAARLLTKDFLKHPKDRRQLEMLSLGELKELAKAAGMTTGGKKSALIDELAKPDNQRKKKKASKKPGNTPIAKVDPWLRPMVLLLRQSFLRAREDAPKLSADIGHRNEEPFLKMFYKQCGIDRESNDNPYSFASMDPVAIYRLGLMRKKGSRFAKASLDGVTFVRDDDGDIELVPTEVKSRVSPSTLMEAKDRIQEVIGAEHFDPRKRFLVQTTSDTTLLRLLVRDELNPKRANNEAFQLLHGAHVAGSKRGLLLVGSKDSLMHAIDVRFNESLLDAYDDVIDYLYSEYAKLFHEGSVDDVANNTDIPRAIKHLGFLDDHSFWSSYMLWREFNVNVNEANLWFPLPPCANILPFQNAWWNVLKGPSDTTTKLLDFIEEQLGVRSPRTIATARLLSVGAIAFHRSLQILSAKDPAKYATLFDYRHAASSRYTSASSICKLVSFMTEDYKRLTTQAPSTAVSFLDPLIPPNTPPRRTRAGEEAPQRVEWTYLRKQGITPARGRGANDAHKLREQNCSGQVLVFVTDTDGKPKQAKCRLCNTKTSYYCTGCKNHLCFGANQGLTSKRLQQIDKKDVDGAVYDEKPKAMLKMMSFDPTTEEWEPAYAKNCCYLIRHKKCFDAIWEIKKLESVELEDYGDEGENEDSDVDED